MSSTINATTASGGGVITTADASGILQLQTGGTTALTIDASQEVGIGTSAPNTKLSVTSGVDNTAGDSITSAVSTVTGVTYNFNTGFNPALFQVMSNSTLGADVGATIGLGGRYTGTQFAQFALIKGAKENATDGNYSSYLAFGTRVQGGPNVTEKMRIDSSGNVGIGTSSPSSFGKFAVVGSNTGGAIVNYFSNSWTTATANTQVVLSLDPGGNGYGVRDCQIRAINNGINQNSLAFYTSNGAAPVEALRIDSSGNVGIGNLPSGTYKLEVTGGISATSLSGLTTPLSVAQGGSGGLVGGVIPIQPITASVGASALTCTLNPTILNFRNTPLTSGTINTRTVGAAISLVVPSTATLGCLSSSAQYTTDRLILIAIDNAGTVELAVANLAGGNNLDETTLISTTALSITSNLANVVYSTTARTSLPFRVVGQITLPAQATAGTWATAPSTIQGQGGQALAAMSSLGYGQTWQAVTRTSGTTYYNATGKPIFLFIQGNVSPTQVAVFINGYQFGVNFNSSTGNQPLCSFIIPANQSYRIDVGVGSIIISELR